jgi:ABC-2 type transport system permease protein
MKQYFSKQNRALLSELVRTDFKLRYQGSVLGYAWSLLRPLLLFGILYVIFALVLNTGKDIPHFPVYLLLGIVLWTFFTDMTSQSLGSIVGRGDLIRKIKIPRWSIVLTSSISAVINLGLNLIVVAIAMAINHVSVLTTLPLVLLILVEVYALALGISLFLAAAFVRYRDLSYIWEVLLQAGFYLTPILYSMTFIPNVTFQKLQLLNPMAQSIQDARFLAITHNANVITTSRIFHGGYYMLIPLLLVVAVLVFGIMYFKKQSGSFAENL